MIFILTGAGISQESGLDTFRGQGGLWGAERIEDVATPGGFKRDPARVYAFYNSRRRELGGVEPNAAHLALAHLEAGAGQEVFLVTQNVDDLHDRAGSKNLRHMHGELLKARCLGCGAVSIWPEDLDEKVVCPACDRAGLMRPHIVWFEEMPLYMDEIGDALNRADIFVSIGTSGNVYPAAGFVRQAADAGADTLELNLEPSLGRSNFQNGLYGPATEVVPAWVNSILNGKSL